MRTQTGETLLYSGWEGDAHLSDVAVMLNKKAAGCFIALSQANDRIITARFNSRYISTTIVQVYAPVNEDDEEAKDVLYDQVQNCIDNISKHDIVLLMETGMQSDQQNGEGVLGHHRLHGERSENGWRFVELCASNNMVITTTLFPHKNIYKHTWVSPDNRTRNQIDHVAVCGKFRRLLLDTCASKSDHHVVIAKVNLQLCGSGKKVNMPKMYNAKLKVPDTAQISTVEEVLGFQCRLRKLKAWLKSMTGQN